MCGLCSQIGLTSDFTARLPVSKHKTLFRPSILQKAISNQVQYAMYIPSYPQQDCFHYGFYQFKCLHQFRICGTPLHVQPALLKLDLKSYPSRISQPFISIRNPPWLRPPGDLNTDQLSICRYFDSLTFLQGWHLCVQLLGASQDDVSDVSKGSKAQFF